MTVDACFLGYLLVATQLLAPVRLHLLYRYTDANAGVLLRVDVL